MGRRRIEMKYIENPSTRQVTFSKRRSGIFKKADSLVTLCGVNVGILIFSPIGRPYVYGNPSFFDVAEHFLTGNRTSSDLYAKKEAMKTVVTKLQDELERLWVELEKKEEICKGLKKRHEENLAKGNLKDIDSLSLEELIGVKDKLIDVQKKMMLSKDMVN